jgi:hypothetical protein
MFADPRAIGNRPKRQVSATSAGPVLCFGNKAVAALNMLAHGFPGTWHHRTPRCSACVALIGALALYAHWASAAVSEPAPPDSVTTGIEQLTEIMV